MRAGIPMSRSSFDSTTPTVAITAGDPNGIGPEIIAKALHHHDRTKCLPVVIGDPAVLEPCFARWAPGTTLVPAGEGSAAGSTPGPHHILTIDPTPDPHYLFPSIPEAVYIQHAVEGCLSGRYQAMVTAPICKHAMYARGFRFPGHTEFVAHLTGVSDPTMMFVADGLRVSLVTIHLPLGRAIEQVTHTSVCRTIRVTAQALQDLFGVANPSIAVCGLNPHAGEEGHLGREEQVTIIPAIAEVRAEGLDIKGPLPSDSLFPLAVEGKFDAVVAMYHDQGLIPVKLLSFRQAVNLTVGIPIVRASVDHGVAYDLAGKGVADPSSLRAALRVAAEIANRRLRGGGQEATGSSKEA